MGWFGKVVGGSIGFMLGGPLGAVAGAAFGHGIDALAEEGEAGMGGRRLDAHESSQYVFFVTTFSLLAKMAKADGVVKRAEVDTVDHFIREQLRANDQARRLAIRVFSEAKTSPHSFESFAVQFHRTFQHDPQMRLGMLEILYRVALADGELHPEEDRLVRAAERIFELPSSETKRLRSIFVPDTDQHYAVLGCQPNDSMETIRSRYRALSREHHPDRVVAKGLPEEFVTLANQKLQEINEAYAAIKKRHQAK